MKIENGRKNFYQWELNQRLIVDEDCTMVQFANGTTPNALGVEVKEEDGTRYAEVPNILLQTAADLHAYAWNEETTSVVHHAVFPVWPAAKPAQYAYNQTEIKQYDLLLEELEKKTAYYKPNVDEEGNLSWQKSMESLPDIKSANIRGPQGERGPQGKEGAKGKDAPQIDDTVASADTPWSSKNIVDKLCPSFTETGVVVTCEPLEGYPLEVISEVPYTDGQPLSTITLTRLGKNLLGYEDFSVSSTTYKMSCTDGVHTFVATSKVQTAYIQPSNLSEYLKSSYLTPGTYVLSVKQESTGQLLVGCYAVVEMEDGTTVNLPDGQAVTLTQPGNVVGFRVKGGTVDSIFAKGTKITYTVQIERGSAATEYEPYIGQTYTADFSDYELTDIEGTYNWTTGVLVDRDIEMQFKPQPMPAYSGVNTFISSTGNTTVKGKKDPVALINKLEATVNALLGG